MQQSANPKTRICQGHCRSSKSNPRLFCQRFACAHCGGVGTVVVVMVVVVVVVVAVAVAVVAVAVTAAAEGVVVVVVGAVSVVDSTYGLHCSSFLV